ncbi:MAG: fibronectin type III domain-containing protein [Candidatus Woesebacteria bacterium]
MKIQRKKLICVFIGISLLFIFLFNKKQSDKIRAQASPSISNITISPDLDISLFSPYTISADISNYSESDPVTIEINGINGDGGSNWDYYVDGTIASETLSFDMSFVSGNTWQKTNIYPDYIYPEIFFAPSSITWNNTPSNIVIRRNNYHLLHFANSFSMVNEMSFWIEVNAIVKAANSADLQVYLVKKDKSISFFQSDWRNSDDVELVGTISRDVDFHHQHTANSSHHLISLATNADGTIGSKSLDISDDFWIILYNTSPNNNRAWDLRYHGTSLCNNDNRWYMGDQIRWLTTTQAGCPDVHIHIARRPDGTIDGVEASITAGETTTTEEFYFADLPNLAPNSTSFTYPLGGTFEGNIEITWDPASDANGDSLTYNLYLLDSDGSVLSTLDTDLDVTNYTFDSTSVSDGTYGLKGSVCDDAIEPLCTDFFSENNFTVDNTDPIQTLSSIILSSNNADNTLAITGNTVTITFVATGTISTPTVSIYSGGDEVNNSITTVNPSANNWTSSYQVDSSDTNGYVVFNISSPNLGAEYSETTDESYVVVNNPTPTPTASPTPAQSTAVSQTSEVSAPQCNANPPSSAPDLFQIDVTSDQATLYYTAVNNVTDYFIAYGEEKESFPYGTLTGQQSSEGVLSFTINLLKANTNYYFKVRGQNNCMPGSWSNIQSIITVNDKKTVFLDLLSPELSIEEIDLKTNKTKSSSEESLTDERKINE